MAQRRQLQIYMLKISKKGYILIKYTGRGLSLSKWPSGDGSDEGDSKEEDFEAHCDEILVYRDERQVSLYCFCLG
jgi:hypothetical protein